MPGGVFLITAGLSLAYYAAGYPDGPATLALLIAIYTVAVQGDGGRSPRRPSAPRPAAGGCWPPRP